MKQTIKELKKTICSNCEKFDDIVDKKPFKVLSEDYLFFDELIKMQML